MSFVMQISYFQMSEASLIWFSPNSGPRQLLPDKVYANNVGLFSLWLVPTRIKVFQNFVRMNRAEGFQHPKSHDSQQQFALLII
jgi:hypothetical protein